MKLTGLHVAQQDAVYFWRDQGHVVVPLVFASKVPAVPWTEWRDQLLPDEQIDEWYGTMGLRNLGVLLSGDLHVVDFDDMNEYQDLKTLEVKTGRGIHAYVYLDEGPKQVTPFVGGELLVPGTLVTVPPSFHNSGKWYVYRNGLDIRRFKAFTELGLPKPPISPQNAATGRTDAQKTFYTCKSRRISLPVEYGENDLGEQKPSEYVREHVRPVEVLSRYGIEVNRNMALCPFHDDRVPSMIVAEYWVKCFNPSCIANKAMSVITLTMALGGMDFSEALRELMKGALKT